MLHGFFKMISAILHLYIWASMSASSSPKCHWVNTSYALYAPIDFVAKMALHHLVLSLLR